MQLLCSVPAHFKTITSCERNCYYSAHTLMHTVRLKILNVLLLDKIFIHVTTYCEITLDSQITHNGLYRNT